MTAMATSRSADGYDIVFVRRMTEMFVMPCRDTGDRILVEGGEEEGRGRGRRGPG